MNMRAVCAAVAVAGIAAAPISCKREVEQAEPATAPPEQAAQSAPVQVTSRLKDLYERAKRAGESVPDNVMDWARADIERIGDWDYTIATMQKDTDGNIQARLQSLGSNRWECFWIEQVPDGQRYYFKRPQRSFLRIAGEAAKYIPTSPGGGE